jgi:hypothetical protein
MNATRRQPDRKRDKVRCAWQEKLAVHRPPEAGGHTAIIYSIVISCRRRGKDTLAYLRDVLARLPAMTNQDDLTLLLPANWTPPRGR